MVRLFQGQRACFRGNQRACSRGRPVPGGGLFRGQCACSRRRPVPLAMRLFQGQRTYLFQWYACSKGKVPVSGVINVPVPGGGLFQGQCACSRGSVHACSQGSMPVPGTTYMPVPRVVCLFQGQRTCLFQEQYACSRGNVRACSQGNMPVPGASYVPVPGAINAPVPGATYLSKGKQRSYSGGSQRACSRGNLSVVIIDPFFWNKLPCSVRHVQTMLKSSLFSVCCKM